MKIPNIGNVMNKFEILGVVGEGKFNILWGFEQCAIISTTKKVINSNSIMSVRVILTNSKFI